MWIFVNIFGLFLLLKYLVFTWDGSLEITSSKKIDWNDYELINREASRTGFGEHGKGEKLEVPEDIKKNEELFKQYGMSVLISDKMSVNRSIPDFRHPDCMKKKYFSQLPKVSIIIIFNNEVFSVFKRTLHSLFNRTPHKLIEEVILVNDNSTLDYLYGPLQKYIDKHFSKLSFKIINLRQRLGLMKARVVGAKAAKSDFLFVMEPHCEMAYNWLPPLIEPLLGNPRTVTVPIIDNVEYKKLMHYEHDKGNLGSRGVFDWWLDYKTLTRTIDGVRKANWLDPFSTPIMTGGVFMIHKKYFFEIGPYDEELLIWGAENIEMSLKIHLCGGELLEVPCSRIGHYFRAFTKSRKHESGIDFLSFNQKRIVEVWFDDYKEIIYEKNSAVLNIDGGDLTKAKELKEKLNCKPFKYFLDVIAPDLLERYPLNQPSFAAGRIQLLNESLCLEAENEPYTTIKLKKCNSNNQNQAFELSFFRDIRVIYSELCMDSYKVMLWDCKCSCLAS